MNLLNHVRQVAGCGLFLLGAVSLWGQQPEYVSAVWNPDLGDGTYKNPVICADYSDPDVCAVGNDFYLTASSFACIPFNSFCASITCDLDCCKLLVAFSSFC